MSYSTSNPPQLLIQGIDNSVGPKIWTLSGTDADTTVDGSGYITNAGQLGMKKGDIVFYTKTDASPIANFIFNVTSISTTSPYAADLSNSTAITATNSD
jgi:hypothetical protein